MDELHQVVEKLQTAADAIDDMEAATDYQRYTRAFRECLSALKSVQYKLNGETVRYLRKSDRRKEITEFREWWDQRIDDPLIAWIGRVRDGDIHQESEELGSSYSMEHWDGADAEPQPPGAALGIGPQGPVWVFNKGTARERRVPVKMREGTKSAQAQNVLTVVVTHPPRERMGLAIDTNSPITLCRLALTYWQSVTEQVYQLWWSGTT